METCFVKRVMLLWFVALTTFCPSAWGCNKEQKRALLEIRNSTDGLAFKDFDGGDCCGAGSNYYIRCNDRGLPYLIYSFGIDTASRAWIPNVTLFTLFGELQELYLGGINIGGELQPFCELKRLKSLRILYLGGNKLEGNIPSCLGTIESLEQLYLSGNRLHGNLPLSIFSNHSKIKLFDVSYNQLDGNIPSGLGMIESLEQLDLSGNRLHGNLPSSIFSNHSKIRVFDVSNNELDGNIPSGLGTIESLEQLDLSRNRLHGNLPSSIFSNHSKIRVFDVSYNQLDGNIPSSLGTIENLERLDLSRNRLHGNLPSSIFSNHSKIRVFDVSDNQLDGSIPSGLGTIESLEQLDLSGNRLHGNLPSSIFSNHSTIMVFDVSDNQLEGNIPSYPGIIQQFDISNNRFHGNVPSSIFSNQSQIYWFDVSGNQLEGLVSFSIFANSSGLVYLDLSNNNELEVETESPSWIPTFQLTTLKLANCNLNKKDSHVVPSFISTQINLQILDLSYNSLEGGIPCQLFLNTNTSILSLRSNKIEGSFLDCFINGTLSNLRLFDISDNRVKGPLPENLGSIFSSLYVVYMSSNELEGKIPYFGSMPLQILDLSHNMLSGTIPRNLTGNDTTLAYLNLSNNMLQGEMLPRDSNLTQLECLYLGGNHFEGMISPAISNSPLVILDARDNNLSGNIPKWLYDHPHLVAVLLSGNHLEGHLTQRMCRMQRLQVFDVSRNRLSGGIPSCLDNVTFWKKSSPSSTDSNYFMKRGQLYYLLSQSNGSDFGVAVESMFRIKYIVHAFQGVPLLLMTGIDLSSNQLTGGIPIEMGELSQLRSLNLSHNSLIGSIPISFQNLKSVENLDLSHNKLRGKIPSELVGLTSLSAFSVAYNNLSGQIPFERQFSTFEMQCYDGNPELCGGPLPRKCSSTNQLKEEKDEKERNRIFDHPLFFYGFVAVSYAFGFWAFFGILIIKKNWREKYFRAVDRYIESLLEFLSKYR